MTAEKSTQMTKKRHQYSFTVKYRGTTHIWNRVTICGKGGEARYAGSLLVRHQKHPGGSGSLARAGITGH